MEDSLLVLLFVHLFITIHWNVFVLVPLASSGTTDKYEKRNNIVKLNIGRLVGLFIVDIVNPMVGVFFDFFGLFITLFVFGIFKVGLFEGMPTVKGKRIVYNTTAKKKCNHCGALIPETYQICTYCKKSVMAEDKDKKTCPTCGTKVGKYATTCPSCNSKIYVDKTLKNNDF